MLITWRGGAQAIVVSGLPCDSNSRESACKTRRLGFDPGVGKISQRRKRLPTPVFLSGDFQGRRRNLADYSPRTCKESDTTEQRTTGLPCWLSGKETACSARRLGLIPGSVRSPGGRYGNPLQYSCLENPMDRGAWWATPPQVRKEWDTIEAT